MPARLSEAVQDYLKAIHSLGGADHLVTPAEIAGVMAVKAPSVTAMLKRLAEAKWIEYTPGDGAKLTPSGVTEARQVVRRHRLIELFLTQVLGLDWSEVDAEAEALEHAISPRLEQAIADYLGQPLEDPHGHLIPTSDGELHRRTLHRLNEFQGGDSVIVREAQDDNSDRLRHWQNLGLKPGAIVRILSYQPLDDVFEITVGGRVLRLGSEGLVGLRGERIEEVSTRSRPD